MCPHKITVKNKRTGQYMQVPCGHCLPCRAARARSLAYVCNLKLYECYRKGFGSSFVTLTYSDDHLPFNEDFTHPTLLKSDLQKFFKNLRRQFEYHSVDGFEPEFYYLACGEYGDNSNRPHYHICMIGVPAPIMYEYGAKCWNYTNHGIIDVGSLRTGGVSYVTKYCFKSFTGKQAKELYDTVGIERPFIVHSKSFETSYVNFLSDEACGSGSLNFTGKNELLPTYYRKKYSTSVNQDVIKPLLQSWKKYQQDNNSDISFDRYTAMQAKIQERILYNSFRKKNIPVDMTLYNDSVYRDIPNSYNYKSIIDDIVDPVPF